MLAGNANLTNGYTEGLLFRSTNYGVTWQPASAFGYWYKVAISVIATSTKFPLSRLLLASLQFTP